MIDDSKPVCLTVKRQLQGTDVLFVACNQAEKALAMTRHFGPTVILLELNMGGASGARLLTALRQDSLTQDIPIIVFSDIVDPEIKATAFAAGADDYAEKGISTVELRGRIAYHTRAYLNAGRLDHSLQELMETQKRIEIQHDFIRRMFGRYVSDEVATSLLETPQGLALGGEKRVITIMMADLRGFTSLSEKLPPETVLSIVNNFLTVMTEVLYQHNGTINEILGDAILAMFGAPIQRPDDGARAVACAIAMQLAMAEVNHWNAEHGYPDIAMGIGINTGEVVVGNIGSERRSKYGAVGQSVNLTARVESFTVGGQILISESTRQACGDVLAGRWRAPSDAQGRQRADHHLRDWGASESPSTCSFQDGAM